MIALSFARTCPNAQFAQRLLLSDKTVRNYISNIFSKLQVADRAAGLGEKNWAS